MAGKDERSFRELVSPFLKKKLQELKSNYGVDSPQYQAISKQYLISDEENVIHKERQRRRHYEAEIFGEEKGFRLKGVERLYRRSVVLEPTTVCLAHCRWCLRANYEKGSLSPSELAAAMKYFASDNELREILITGGDPIVALPLTEYILDNIEQRVPQIEIVRIGTRMLTQNPKRVDQKVLKILKKKRRYKIELGILICHAIELWPETIEAINKLLDIGVRLYNQHPLLKGVNDTAEVLYDLYDRMRYNNIEPHYMFHCVPMRGMEHHRTSVKKGLDLISMIDSGGYFSGRSKPLYTAMTDVGKVVLYHGSVKGKDEDRGLMLLKSGYKYEDRMRWNPSWKKPSSCEIDSDGYMSVWYPDGPDDHNER